MILLRKIVLFIIKNKLMVILLTGGIFVFPISLVALLYAIGDSFPIFKTHISASDALSYTISFFASICTLSIGFIAIKQNEQISNINEKLLKLEEDRDIRSKISIVDITYNKSDNIQYITNAPLLFYFNENNINLFLEGDKKDVLWEHFDNAPTTDIYNRFSVNIKIENYSDLPIKKVEATAYLYLATLEADGTTSLGKVHKLISEPVLTTIMKGRLFETSMTLFILKSYNLVPSNNIFNDLAFYVHLIYTNYFDIETHAKLVCKYDIGNEKYYLNYHFIGRYDKKEIEKKE